MRIVIDYHGPQRSRGSGSTHAASLAQAIARAALDHEVTLVLDGRFADSVDEASARFASLGAGPEVRVWHPPQQGARPGPSAYPLARKKLYEAFIASLRPDIALIAFAAAEPTDEAPVSVGNFATMPTAVILPDVPRTARAHADAIRRADMWFATSEAARQEALAHLGLDAARGRLAAPKDGSGDWSAPARWAIEGLESLRRASIPRAPPLSISGGSRPRMAWVSPLPVAPGDSADNDGASLLAELASHYDIDLVTGAVPSGEQPPASAWPIRSVEWFREHACAFDRVLYHLGNSAAYAHVPALLDEIPGVVLLHEFDLDCLVPAATAADRVSALYASHGYAPLAGHREGIARRPYPCNFDVFAQAQGVIVHSPRFVELAQQWFGDSMGRGWAVLDADSPQAGLDHIQAIEGFAAAAAIGRDGLIQSIAEDQSRSEPADEAAPEWLEFAQALADALPDPMPQAQLFIDVSELVQRDSKTGIQRVVKSLLQVLLEDPPPGYRVEPVYATDQRLGYRYARKFSLGFIGAPQDALEDTPLDLRRGDVFVGLDLQPHLIPRQRDFFRRMRHSGVRVEFVVYDLLPILLTHRFSRDAAAVHSRWLEVVAENDGALCISQAVANELADWLAKHAPERLAAGFRLQAFHLGADLHNSAPTRGLPSDADETLRTVASGSSFLMVGTVEPRKGHALALDAFESLWSAGVQARLVVAGKQGWMVDDVARRMRNHPERGQRLFWLEQVSDEYLEQLYAAASCLLAASEGEGFGLPLIESARHRLPILARDLPVFQEVAGPHALYFEGSAAALAAAVREWLNLFEQRLHPPSDAMPYLTWKQSAQAFKSALRLPQKGDAATHADGSAAPAHLS